MLKLFRLYIYGLPKPARVIMKLYSVLGQEIRILVNGVEPAGFRSITLDANNLPSGVYLYRIEATALDNPAQTFLDVKKMILMK